MRRMTSTPRYYGRLRAFQGENAADDAYEMGLWIRAALLKDNRAWEILDARNPEIRQQTITPPSAGGYTVPTPLSSTIIEVVNEVSVAMRTADVVPMTAQTLSIPKVLSGQTVYYPGEATAITTSEMTWGNVALSAVKKATLTKISNELLADSIINMADRVAQRAAYEIAWQLDNEYINGDGTGTYGGHTGLLPALAAAGKVPATGNSWSSIILEDFNKLMGTLPDRFYVDGPSSRLVPCCWIMSRQFYASVVQKLMYAAGGNTTDNIQAGTGPQLMGYPIYFTARMPADGPSSTACLFGNFMEAVVLGVRNDVLIASSDQYAFNEDVLTIRTTMRTDINVHEPGNGGVGAYVSLETTA